MIKQGHMITSFNLKQQRRIDDVKDINLPPYHPRVSLHPFPVHQISQFLLHSPHCSAIKFLINKFCSSLQCNENFSYVIASIFESSTGQEYFSQTCLYKLIMLSSSICCKTDSFKDSNFTSPNLQFSNAYKVCAKS